MLASTCSIRRWIEARVVLVAGIHRLEPTAIDGGDGMGEQIEPSAQRDELATGRQDRRTVVLSEVRDGLEVRRQSTGQPHHFDIALRLAFQTPARSDLADVAVDANLQQRGR